MCWVLPVLASIVGRKTVFSTWSESSAVIGGSSIPAAARTRASTKGGSILGNLGEGDNRQSVDCGFWRRTSEADAVRRRA